MPIRCSNSASACCQIHRIAPLHGQITINKTEKTHISSLYPGKQNPRQRLFVNGAVERQLRFIRPVCIPGSMTRNTCLVINDYFSSIGQAVHTINLDFEADAADFRKLFFLGSNDLEWLPVFINFQPVDY